MRWISRALDLFYPQVCMHCREIKDDEGLFCAPCNVTLEMIDPAHRCHYCFSKGLTPTSKICKECRTQPIAFHRVGSVFNYEGPPATLIKKMKYGAKPYLAEGAGAFMAAQFDKLGWPTPDFVTSVPMSLLKRTDRGYNQSDLIAQAFSKFTGIPYKPLLIRSHSGFSQAGLSTEQRKSLVANPYTLKKNATIADLKILLIDDVLTTGTTLRKCADALYEGYPSTLYALTFCRA